MKTPVERSNDKEDRETDDEVTAPIENISILWGVYNINRMILCEVVNLFNSFLLSPLP